MQDTRLFNDNIHRKICTHLLVKEYARKNLAKFRSDGVFFVRYGRTYFLLRNSTLLYYMNKRDFMIEKQLPRLIMKYTKYLAYPSSLHLPFYATQIINPFLNSRMSAKNDKVKSLSAKW